MGKPGVSDSVDRGFFPDAPPPVPFLAGFDPINKGIRIPDLLHLLFPSSPPE
jgi:hypothetical protein